MNWQRCASDALARAVQAMSGAASEEALCRACCAAISADAAYPSAWIGYAEELPAECGAAMHDKTPRIVSLDGLVGACSIALVLPFPIEPSRALVVGASDPDAFSEDAVRTLANLAGVIEFGISGFRRTSPGIARSRAPVEPAHRLRMLNLLNTISDSSNDAIFAKDLDGRYLYVNCEVLRQTGKTQGQVIGRTDEEVYSVQASTELSIRDRSVMHLGHSQTFEEALTTVDGTRIFLTTKGPLKDADGKVFGVFGISRDITELNEYRNELKRSELAKSRFLAAAGHDLRQPLTAANMFIHALKSTEMSELQASHVRSLGRAMSTFSDLLDALLNISRLDAGVIKPERELIDVSEILIWLEQNFAAQARERRLGFRLYFPISCRLHIRSDRGLIKAVLMNLVLNAIKFTEQGAILVSARQRGAHVLFQVWDTGIGIPEAELEHIFDEFYQVDNPQRDRANGLGLGLSISRRSVALLGGEIRCRSKPYRGSVFGFQLPLTSLPNPVLPRDEHAAMVDADRRFVSGKKFVVVENDIMVAQAIAAALRGLGGIVECFHSAEQARRDASAQDADYYIVDYMLGGSLDGVQYLNLLSENALRRVRAVLITGDTSSRFIRESTLWPVLFKPLDLTGLIATLGTAR